MNKAMRDETIVSFHIMDDMLSKTLLCLAMVLYIGDL